MTCEEFMEMAKRQKSKVRLGGLPDYTMSELDALLNHMSACEECFGVVHAGTMRCIQNNPGAAVVALIVGLEASVRLDAARARDKELS